MASLSSTHTTHDKVDGHHLSAAQLIDACPYEFPDPISADPDGYGVIALGADLAPETLLAAYAQGLFPWFNEDEPIAWWSPEPRCVLSPADYQPSKSLARQSQKSRWRISINEAFAEVIEACSLPRYEKASSTDPSDKHADGGDADEGDADHVHHTWIHDEMIVAYTALHALGFAHSVEVWQDDRLIGGLYGLKIGQVFFGESMFHQVSNASKMAFWALSKLCVSSGVQLIDCQLPNPHLMSLGAKEMSRREFLGLLKRLRDQHSTPWVAQNFAPIALAKLTTDAPWA